MIDPKRAGAWTIYVTAWRDGLVGELDLAAVRTDGTEIPLTVFLFPAGWRLYAPGVPKVVRTGAMQLANEWSVLL